MSDEMRALKIRRRLRAMPVHEVEYMLKELNINVTRSKKDRQRLRETCNSNYFAGTLLLSRNIPFKYKCPFKYIFVIDFEATCDQPNSFYPHEIIEFPVCLIDTDELKIIDTFHSYVRPVVNPVLTEFCTSLTGITQEMVDKSDTFEKVLDAFCKWKEKHVGLDKTYAVLTDGPYDMERFLVLQCVLCQIEYPAFGKHWINIKALFCDTYSSVKFSLLRMLDFFDLEFEGKLHSGKDDAYNIAKLAIAMLEDDVQFNCNGKITSDSIKCQVRALHSYFGVLYPEIKIGRSSKSEIKSYKKQTSSKIDCDKKLNTVDSMIEVDPAIAGTESILIKNKTKNHR